MSKSHVGMGHNICPFCGVKHSEVILLDKQLKDTLEPDMFLGFELCNEHKEMAKEYVFLIGSNSNPNDSDKFDLTGINAAIRRKEALDAFKMDITKYDYVFVAPEVIEMLSKPAVDNTDN